MKFEKFFTMEFSDDLYHTIQQHDLLNIDSTSFYFSVLSVGKCKECSPLVDLCIEQNNTSVLQNICVQKNLDRWLKIHTSLNKNYTAFDNEIELLTSNQQIDTNTTNNFDIYDSLNNSVKVDNKENSIVDKIEKTDTIQKSKSNIKDFNHAIKNFIDSTEFNTDDVIVNDIVKILTLDVY